MVIQYDFQTDLENLFIYRVRYHIPAYHLGPYRFLTDKNFVIEVRIKVEFSELSETAFRKMKQF